MIPLRALSLSVPISSPNIGTQKHQGFCGLSLLSLSSLCFFQLAGKLRFSLLTSLDRDNRDNRDKAHKCWVSRVPMFAR